MTPELAGVPVEELRAGDLVLVSERIGWRPVVDVRVFDSLGLEQVETFVIVYEPLHQGLAWENRAKAKGLASTFDRDEGALAPLRRGSLVQARKTRQLTVLQNPCS